MKIPTVSWVPIVATIPHSGLWVPAKIQETWTYAHRLSLRNTDWHLSELYSFLPGLGIHVIEAEFNRYVIDVNRNSEECLFGDFGKCVVARKNSWGEPIYENKEPSKDDLNERLALYYNPFHRKVSDVLDSVRSKFGSVLLLDLHSFMGPLREDICLGNVNGSTSSKISLQSLKTAFESQHYRVVINEVYKGGHIVKKFGLVPQTEAIQIELRYPCYLPEEGLDDPKIPQVDSEKMNRARERVKSVFKQFATAATARIET